MAANWKTICCPVDFSEPSRAALALASDLARRLGSDLVLLHVTAEGKLAEEIGGRTPLDLQLSAWMAEAQRLGANHVRLAAARVQPEVAIVEHARTDGIDLIVMGTHGRTDREKMLAGSVAEGVVRTAGCPVLTVHPSRP